MSTIYRNEYDDLLDEFLESLPDDAAMRRRMAVLKQWDQPKFREKLLKTLNGIHTSQEHKQRSSAIMRQNWEDPEFDAKIRDAARRLLETRYANIETAHVYKGAVKGINLKTGEEIILKGTKAITEAGFNHGNVYACINGQKQSYKGYRWIRIVKGSGEEFSKPFVKKPGKRLPYSLIGTDASGKQVYVLHNSKDIENVGLHRSRIYSAIKHGTTYKGLSWTKT